MADEDNKKTGDLLTAVQNRATKTRRDIAAAFERAKTQHRPSLAYLNEQTRSTREAITPILHVHHSVAKFAHSHWDQCDNDTKIQLAAVGGLAVGFFVAKTSAGVRSARARFRTVDDIPAAQFQQKVWLRTHVVKVADGDTIRVRHLPRWSRFNPREGSKLSEETLSVRLAAIDTPETAKFGKEGQPGGDEATQFLSDLILNQSVSIQLLSRDQYSRAVAMVYRGTWPFRKNVCKEMTAAGWATVYKQAGAQYGGELEAFERLEEEAKVSKLGVWGLKAAISAGDPKLITIE